MGGAANICIQGQGTLACSHAIIIFVPGVMGSRLHFGSNDPLGFDYNWDPDTTIDMARWAGTPSGVMRERMHLNGHDTVSLIYQPPTRKRDRWRWGKELSRSDTALSDDQVERRFATVALSSYGQFLVSLDAACAENVFGSGLTPRLYAYGYDWRKSILELGNLLAADIVGGHGTGLYGPNGLLATRKADPGDPIIFITHSMGGLVTRAALKNNEKLRQRTIGVLHGVQPVTGATTFYRRCITGAVSPWDGDLSLCMILGSDGPAFSTVVSGLPGPMNLFPSQRLAEDLRTVNPYGILSWTCFDDHNQAVQASSRNIYDYANCSETTQPPGIVRTDISEHARADLIVRLRQTRDFHADMSCDKTPDGPPWFLDRRTWAFFGAGSETDTSMHFNLPPDKIHWGQSFDDTITSLEPYGVHPDGTEKILDPHSDIAWRGYCPHPELPFSSTITESHRRVGRSKHGDGTVPDVSGSALFPQQQTADITDTSVDLRKVSQFKVPGLLHEKAFLDNDDVKKFVIRWLKFILNRRPPG